MFSNLLLKAVYNSDNDDLANCFYNPILKEAKTFDRTSAFFSGKALSLYSSGLEFFGKQGNKYRLIVSKEISEEDYNEIKKGYEIKSHLRQELLTDLEDELSITEKRRLSNLAYLVSTGIVDIKMAFRKKGIFHDKTGIATDSEGNVICFKGSNNETQAAIDNNYESLQVTCSWLDCDGFYSAGIKDSQEEFEALWNNQKHNLIVLPMDEVVLNRIIKHSKGRLIVEDVLLEENAMILDYDGQLMLHLNSVDINKLVNSAFYKMRLKSKVDSILGNTVWFNPDLVYLDYIKIDELLKSKSSKFDCQVFETKRLLDYIDQRNLHIRERSKLGIELKTDPKNLQDKYEMFKRIVDNQMERPLREKQMKDAFFMYAMAKAGNFSVPGSGKTASVLGVFAFLEANDLVDRLVMIGPKNSFGSWIDEFRSCFGEKKQLKCFNIHSPEYNSRSMKKKVLKFDSGNFNLFLFNYESVHSYDEELESIIASRTLLVFDEVHKVKMINGERANAALKVSRDASHIIAMTGTPIPNTYQDIYNFLHILFHDEYREFFGFTPNYLKNPSITEVGIINDKIQPFFCRTTKKELEVPDANEDISDVVRATDEERKLYEILCKKYRNNKLALFIRILQLESNPKMLLKALDIEEFSKILDINIEEEFVDYIDYTGNVLEIVEHIQLTSKKAACIKRAEELVALGKPVVIWCIFIDSISSIKEFLSSKGISCRTIYGGVPLEERQSFIEEFKNREFDVLITNPHTLAESVSLHSVCHDAIYFEYSYNLVHLLQSKDRIHRLGLPQDQYTQYYFLKSEFETDEGIVSIDDNVYNRLKEKEQVMLDAIDNHVLEPTYTDQEDLDVIFGTIL